MSLSSTHPTLRPLALVAVLCLALAACTEDAQPLGDSGTSPSDAAARDAEPAADATPAPDATPIADAAATDAVAIDLGFADAATPDATEPDTGVVNAGAPDTGPVCDAIGEGCTSSCATPYVCQNGACLPEQRDTCGGFAGATCPATFPDCLFFAGADYGPCFTRAEHTCVCAQPNAHARFPLCP